MRWKDCLDDFTTVGDGHSLANVARPVPEFLYFLDAGEAEPHVCKFAKHHVLSCN